MIKKILKRRRFWAGMLLAQFLLFYTVSHFPTFIRLVEQFFEWQKSFHQKTFAVIPFSIGDVFYIVLVIILIFLSVKYVQKKYRSSILFYFLISANLLYFSYQILWGFLYFQPALLTKLSPKTPSEQEAKVLALKLLTSTKNSRTLVKEDENGIFRISDLKIVESEIIKRQTQIPAFLSHKKVTQVNSFKTSLFSPVMSETGILGYYNPFTAEAQYNPNLPSTYLPFTLAHESAHQLGFAREQEANFIGYLIGKDSENAELRYSTEYFALKSLLRNIVVSDSIFVKKVISQYSPAMQRDLQYEKKFTEDHRGVLTTFFAFTNNLFLKSNRQEGSVTYSYFTDLLIRYERSEKKQP